MQSSSSLLSLFDVHLHPVLAAHRETGLITYANQKAKNLFSDELEKSALSLSDVLKNVRLVGNEERIARGEGQFKVHRLESNQFAETVIFFEPVEEEPGKKSLQTGELAASLVAHLFRSPLTALMGLAEMVGTSTEANKEMIAKALSEGLERMGGFVDSLDEFTKSEKVDIQPVQLSALIQNVLYDYPAQERQNIRFFSLPLAQEIETDPRLIREILRELIVNAFEFGADQLSPIEIHQKTERTIWVGNSGSITKELESNVFLPFFSTKSQNWGLGLTRAVKKAHALGGTLRLVENSRIGGIVFELQLNA